MGQQVEVKYSDGVWYKESSVLRQGSTWMARTIKPPQSCKFPDKDVFPWISLIIPPTTYAGVHLVLELCKESEYVYCNCSFIPGAQLGPTKLCAPPSHSQAPHTFVPHPLIPRPHPALCPTLSFTGPTKLFVACSDDKQGKAWEMWLLQFDPNPHHTAFIPHHSQLPTSYIPDLHSFLRPPQYLNPSRPPPPGHSLQPS